ncbi:unnamed protein product, partial [Prorocentrum cordatum]
MAPGQRDWRAGGAGTSMWSRVYRPVAACCVAGNALRLGMRADGALTEAADTALAAAFAAAFVVEAASELRYQGRAYFKGGFGRLAFLLAGVAAADAFARLVLPAGAPEPLGALLLLRLPELLQRGTAAAAPPARLRAPTAALAGLLLTVYACGVLFVGLFREVGAVPGWQGEPYFETVPRAALTLAGLASHSGWAEVVRPAAEASAAAGAVLAAYALLAPLAFVGGTLWALQVPAAEEPAVARGPQGARAPARGDSPESHRSPSGHAARGAALARSPSGTPSRNGLGGSGGAPGARSASASRATPACPARLLSRPRASRSGSCLWLEGEQRMEAASQAASQVFKQAAAAGCGARASAEELEQAGGKALDRLLECAAVPPWVGWRGLHAALAGGPDEGLSHEGLLAGMQALLSPDTELERRVGWRLALWRLEVELQARQGKSQIALERRGWAQDRGATLGVSEQQKPPLLLEAAAPDDQRGAQGGPPHELPVAGKLPECKLQRSGEEAGSSRLLLTPTPSRQKRGRPSPGSGTSPLRGAEHLEMPADVRLRVAPPWGAEQAAAGTPAQPPEAAPPERPRGPRLGCPPAAHAPAAGQACPRPRASTRARSPPGAPAAFPGTPSDDSTSGSAPTTPLSSARAGPEGLAPATPPPSAPPPSARLVAAAEGPASCAERCCSPSRRGGAEAAAVATPPRPPSPWEVPHEPPLGGGPPAAPPRTNSTAAPATAAAALASPAAAAAGAWAAPS